MRPFGEPVLQGERLQYVLLTGHKKQDDAAEDPLFAAKVRALAHTQAQLAKQAVMHLWPFSS